jgi:hypothetical protein
MTEALITPIVLVDKSQTAGPKEVQQIENPTINVTVRVDVT